MEDVDPVDVPAAAITRGRAFDVAPQLRCELGTRARGFYERGAADVEALLEAVEAIGASVRADDTLALSSPPGAA